MLLKMGLVFLTVFEVFGHIFSFFLRSKVLSPPATPTLWSKMQCHNNNADCVEIVVNFWVKSNNALSLTDSRKKRKIRGLGTTYVGFRVRNALCLFVDFSIFAYLRHRDSASRHSFFHWSFKAKLEHFCESQGRLSPGNLAPFQYIIHRVLNNASKSSANLRYQIVYFLNSTCTDVSS